VRHGGLPQMSDSELAFSIEAGTEPNKVLQVLCWE
jgi:hypothetical protein